MPCRSLPSTKLLTIAILAMLPVLSAYAGPQSQKPPRDRDGNEQQQQDERGPERDKKRGDNSSLSDAVRRVERNTRGEVLSAERVQFDGRDMHRVKVVDDQGRVRVFMQDPQRRDDNGLASGRKGNKTSKRPPPTRDDDE
ncbi:MAG: hypothetical protein ABIQ62_03870 [Thermomonas sp.]